MAITSVTKRHLHDGHTAEFTERGIKIAEVYVVISDDPATDWPTGIRDAVDPVAPFLAIPAVGSQHPTESLLRVRNVTPRPTGNGADGATFDVVVQYDTQTDFAGVTNFSGGQIDDVNLTFILNPINRPPVVSWGFEKIQVAKTIATHVSDDDGTTWATTKAITNSAGQSFDPPLIDEETILVGTLTRNEATYNALFAASYVNAVNSDVWAGLPVRTVKFADWTATRRFESNVWYWEHTYTIHINADTWDDVVLDQGLGYLTDGTLTVPKDPDNFAHGQPVRLDGTGAIITAPSTASHYRRFRNAAREKPFDVLNIA